MYHNSAHYHNLNAQHSPRSSDSNHIQHDPSTTSLTPFQPAMSHTPHSGHGDQEKHVHLLTPHKYPPNYDPERNSPSARPTASTNSSFFGQGLNYDPSSAKEDYLKMAKDDVPDNKVARFYVYLLGVSIVTRWFVYIVPILGCIWIPAILQFTKFPNGHIWFTPLLYWSIWLSVLWGGWWTALAFSFIFPRIVKATLGAISVTVRHYSEWLKTLHRYIALFAWSLASWISFIPLINRQQDPNAGQKSKDAVDLLNKLLFALFLCCAILLAEKVLIQAIAAKFHERSYAERLEEQRRNCDTLVTLYAHSTDQIDRNDTLHDAPRGGNEGSFFKGGVLTPDRLLKNVLKGVRGVAQTTTQAFGNIASEIVGSSVLQPNSPAAIVATALTSANKTRLLARRLFYSFRKDRNEVMVISDISSFFPTQEAALEAFAMFDKDSNGDATRDEMELACMELHRERLALASSMRDIDSAVGRLDNILMSVYTFVIIIIFAVTINTQLSTLLSGAAAFILALSWLIGATAQEVLSSIIFLFVKHMYDVGDRVDVDGQSYTVKEIRLLSTIFIDTRGCIVQAPHAVLNGKFIYNMRRSQQMSEPFTFEVAFDTSFEQIEQLRDRMLAFVKAERRDFLPTFDVVVDSFPEQSKLMLKADIKYKSNWQQGALKVQRRNKWVCALKTALRDTRIFGPSGDPSVVAGPTEYTQVPWSEVKAAKDEAALAASRGSSLEPRIPRADYVFSDRNQVILDQGQDVFNEGKELNMTAPKAGYGARGPSGQRVEYRGLGGVSDSRPTAQGAFGGPAGGSGPGGPGGAPAAGAAAAAGGIIAVSAIPE